MASESALFLFQFLPGAFLLAQVSLYLGVFRHLLWGNSGTQQPAANFAGGISVIVIARNEAQNLRPNLPHILAQECQRFEVIVVNDHSTDDTKWVVKELQNEHPHLHLLDLDQHIWDKPGKKLALTLAIKKARHAVIVATDADCCPASPQWLSYMGAPFKDDQVQFTLGFAPYRKAAGLLSAFVRYETFQTAFYYLGLALAGKPYMGVGRNLAYRRQFFFDHQGFGPHHSVAAGDDDLLVNRLSTAANTAVVLAPESFTWTDPPSTFRQWLRQKKRHLSVGKHYKARHKLLLGALWALQVGFYGSLILSFTIVGVFSPVPWSLWGLKFLMFYGVSWPLLRRFQLESMLPGAYGLHLLYHLIYMPTVSIMARYQKAAQSWS